MSYERRKNKRNRVGDIESKIEGQIHRLRDRKKGILKYHNKSIFVNTIGYNSYIKHKLQLWRQEKKSSKIKIQFFKR